MILDEPGNHFIRAQSNSVLLKRVSINTASVNRPDSSTSADEDNYQKVTILMWYFRISSVRLHQGRFLPLSDRIVWSSGVTGAPRSVAHVPVRRRYANNWCRPQCQRRQSSVQKLIQAMMAENFVALAAFLLQPQPRSTGLDPSVPTALTPGRWCSLELQSGRGSRSSTNSLVSIDSISCCIGTAIQTFKKGDHPSPRR